ncbi:NADH oxidase family-domain-containing protein [Lentinula edodes]|uniref:NADH oxidase family-domain-containing protein n=1 Tax=Lentinula edodes TaxID=5353 RepID=UPI001E8E44A1|nr:NADH oxidase family-domain-containing protein [Lentinula edodes]KAH7876238.1 NADH oxidase family-domain-containing protein [Lentinula edodes]
MSPATQIATANLFSPIKIGNMLLNHRVIMAPLTRLRTTKTSAVLKVVKEYYSQRASTPGTFLISEGTVISPRATGFQPCAPGIWSDEQITAWKEVLDAVHAKGSYIYLQIAASGRIAQSSVLQSYDPTYDVVSAGDETALDLEPPPPSNLPTLLGGS